MTPSMLTSPFRPTLGIPAACSYTAKIISFDTYFGQRRFYLASRILFAPSREALCLVCGALGVFILNEGKKKRTQAGNVSRLYKMGRDGLDRGLDTAAVSSREFSRWRWKAYLSGCQFCRQPASCRHDALRALSVGSP